MLVVAAAVIPQVEGTLLRPGEEVTLWRADEVIE
jgi:hypothetical protein